MIRKLILIYLSCLGRLARMNVAGVGARLTEVLRFSESEVMIWMEYDQFLYLLQIFQLNLIPCCLNNNKRM